MIGRSAAGADTIVVGSGAAGAVLAARLSEDPARRVLLVEAGGRARSPLYRIPLGIGRLRHARSGLWRHASEPEPHLDGRSLALATGKVLGGSAAINGMVHMRPDDADLDSWGVAGWDAASMAGAFARAEAALTPRRAAAAHPLDQAFLAACREAAPLDFNILDGRRHSTAQAYLAPALGRANLAVLTNAEVSRIVVEGGRARGIEVTEDRGRRRIDATGEIVLAAGALHSPALLLRSGIGPADALRTLGIVPQADLDGVGAGLQNHVDIAPRYACTQPVTLHDLLRAERIIPAMAQAWAFGTGPATRFPGEVAAFIRSDPAEPLPDLLCHLVEGLGIRGIRWPFARAGRDALDREGFSCRIMLLRPASRGRVTLRTADPHEPPCVRFDVLSRPDETRRLIAGVRRMRDVFASPAFAPLRGDEIEPGPALRTDADLAAWIRARADLQCHPVGTCAIGTVVDAELRVRGVEALRVADASVMPRIVGANTFATVVAVAERAAAIMRGVDTPAGDAASGAPAS